MPRSSRTKSRKHSSREVRDYSDSEEDVKMKERNGKEKVSVRVSKDLTSGEKRKVSSKDLSGHVNVDVVDEPVVASKRRKEKGEGGGIDRWNADGEQTDVLIVDKDVKDENLNSRAKELKVSVDSKSRSSRRHDTDKKDDTLNAVVEKEESRSGYKVDSKRRPEKEYGRKEYRDVKEKDRWDKEKLVDDKKDGGLAKKHGSHSVDVNDDRHGKRPRENTEFPVQDQLRNPELEKELEKKVRRRDGSGDKDKYQGDARDNEEKRTSKNPELEKEFEKKVRRRDGSGDKDKYQGDARDNEEKRNSKSERSKDVWSKDERHGHKYSEDGEKYSRHKEDKYREDGKDSRYKDVKYREEVEKDDRYRDSKYREDSDRDNANCDDNYREDGDRDKRHKDDKYREDGERNNRRREDKYQEDGDKDDRHRDDRYREDLNKDNRHNEEKHRDNADRDKDIKRRDMKQRNDSDRDKRSRDLKYREEHSSRDRISEFEIKRVRDENNVADHHYRKSSNRDISPTYDDRGSRYKDDRGNRRATDKEDHNDVRSQSTKDHIDGERRSGSGKVDVDTDRGRSNLRDADADVTLNHSRRRTSPSSGTHAARDHYRVSKIEESKYRDYSYEERTRHNGSSGREFNGSKPNEKVLSSRLMEKPIQKDDSQFNELSADRRPRSDARASPLHMVNKSPPSSIDRRHLNRSDVRRSIDIEESGQRSGGSRDYTGREGKGGRELLTQTHAVDDLSQADVDKSSALSPFTRNFASNSRSNLPPPPPPHRTGVDSPSVYGTEDDNRGRFNNRHRRMGDNMGRPQGSAWKGLGSWPSPVTNGYMPFPHGPPPVGFPSMMPQFPLPIFGVRPAMDLNHNPYHISDADRFSGHGRQLGWQNPVDDSTPPIHGWDANSSVFGDDTRGYGRLDWDQNRTQMTSRGWDTSGELWRGPGTGLNADLTPAPPREELRNLTGDEVLAGQQAQIKRNQQNLQADSPDVQSGDALRNATLDTSENIPVESYENIEKSMKDDVHDLRVYLSRVDISTNLTEPDLYDQITSLMDLDHNKLADKGDCKILYVQKEALEVKAADKVLSSAISDSVFQKAMALYEKHKVDIRPANGKGVPLYSSDDIQVHDVDNEIAALTEGNVGALALSCVGQETEDSALDYKDHVDLPRSSEACQLTSSKKLDEASVTDNMAGSKESIIKTVDVMEMEVDPDSKQENKSTSLPNAEPSDAIIELEVDPVSEHENKSASLQNVELSNDVMGMEMEVDLVSKWEDKSVSLQNVDLSSALKPSDLQEMPPSSPGVNHSANNEQKLIETRSASTLLLSDVSAEAMMPESVESGSVNLSRIHHSPESTH